MVVQDLYENLPTGTKLPANVIQAFIELWQDEGIGACFKRSFEYQLNDSAP